MSLHEAIAIAKLSGKAIDITNLDEYGRGITWVGNDISLNGYKVVNVDGVVIYDKTGFNIKKYNLREFITLDVGSGKLDMVVENENITITIDKDTDLYKLHGILSNRYNMITINCRNIYIHSNIFQTIVSDKLRLINPVLNESVLAAIPCGYVDITTSYYPSYQSLGCTTFLLEYDSNGFYGREEEEHIPIMPSNATDITIGIRNAGNSLKFIGNDNIQRLTLIIDNTLTTVTLDNVSALRELYTYANVLLPLKVLHNLKTLSCKTNAGTFAEVSLEDYEGMGYINLYNNIDDSINIELNNLEMFEGSLVSSDIYSLMTNLKILHVGRIPNYRFLPKKLEEVYLDLNQDREELELFQRHVMGMRFIRRMTLYLTEENLGYPIREGIYYIVFIIDSNDDIIPINEFEGEVPQLDEVMDINNGM